MSTELRLCNETTFYQMLMYTLGISVESDAYSTYLVRSLGMQLTMRLDQRCSIVGDLLALGRAYCHGLERPTATRGA